MKNMVKKTVLAIMAIVMMMSFAACGGTKPKAPAQPTEIITDVDHNIKAKLVISCENYTNEIDVVNAVAAEFNKLYPNVTIELDPFSGSISGTIVRKYNANTMPDIFICNSFDMFTLSDKNILLNFTPYIEQEERNGNFDHSEYYESYWRLGQANFDGVQYMIPRSADRVVMHYRKDIFAEAEAHTGVPISSLVKNGWTWNDFNTVFAAIRKYFNETGKSGQRLLDSYMTWEAVFNPMIVAHGGEYFDADGKFALNTPQTQAAYDTFKSWIDNGWVAPLTQNPANFQGGQGVALFHSTALSIIGSKLNQVLNADNNPDFDMSEHYDIVTMPVYEDKPCIGAGAAGYCAYAGSEHPELCWQFMKMLISKEGQNAMADVGCTYVPVRKDMADYTKAENHWGVGYQNYNLAAYTYNSGGYNSAGTQEPDWNCCTEYFTVKKPKYASDLNKAISDSIQSYMNGKAFDTTMTALKKSFDAILRK